MTKVLTSNNVDPGLPKLVRDRRQPGCHHTDRPFQERRLLYEAFQVNILRRNEDFEKCNLVWLKFDRISALGAIANGDCFIITERSFFGRLGVVEVLKI